MAYNYFPMGYQQPYYQPPQQGVVWVQGIEGAKAHPVGPGQSALMMDSEANCLYLKSADASGMPSLRVFDYTERIATPQKAQNGDVSDFITKEDVLAYATKEDLETAISELKEELKSLKKKGAKNE